MKRKPTEIVQCSLRIREELRLKIEKAAEKRGVSINYEMTDRLEKTFEGEDLWTLSRVRQDIEVNWARWGGVFARLDSQRDLVRVVESLISQIDSRESDRLKDAIAGVQSTINGIKTIGLA